MNGGGAGGGLGGRGLKVGVATEDATTGGAEPVFGGDGGETYAFGVEGRWAGFATNQVSLRCGCDCCGGGGKL